MRGLSRKVSSRKHVAAAAASVQASSGAVVAGAGLDSAA